MPDIGLLQLRIEQQIHLPSHQQVCANRVSGHIQKRPHRRPHQHIHLTQRHSHALKKRGRDVRHILAHQLAIEHAEKHPHDLIGQIKITVEHSAFHRACRTHQDQHGCAAAGLHKLYSPHLGGISAGSGDYRCAPGGPGQQPASPLQQSLWIIGTREQHRVKGSGVFILQRRNLHQTVHIFPIALLGGHPPCGGVGLFQEAQLDEIGHLIADGGRGNSHLFRHSLAPHRFTAFHIPGHHRGEDALFSRCQLQTHHLHLRILALFHFEC